MVAIARVRCNGSRSNSMPRASAHDALLAQIGRERGASAAQVALAWCLRQPDVIAIPKSVHAARIDENLAAARLRLSAAEVARIDKAFPPPKSKRPVHLD